MAKPVRKEPPPPEPVSEVESTARALAIRVDTIGSVLITSPKDADTAARATAQFNQLKTIEKELKTRKEKITKPLNEALKNVRALFAPIEAKLANAVEVVRGGLTTYNREVQQTLADKREALEARVESGKLSERAAAKKIVAAAGEMGAGIIPTRKQITFSITDSDKVADRFWIIDEVLLRREAIAAFRENRPLPTGTSVVEEDIVVKG